MDKNEKNRQEKRQTDLNTDDIFKQEKKQQAEGRCVFFNVWMYSFS